MASDRVFDDLDELRRTDTARQRERLLAARPAGRLRTNWWLGVIQHATLHATADDMPEADRRQWAGLAVLALETALETGDGAAREVATRKASLTLALSRHGRPESFHPALRPDLVVGECLALTDMSPAEAVATLWHCAPRTWTSCANSDGYATSSRQPYS